MNNKQNRNHTTWIIVSLATLGLLARPAYQMVCTCLTPYLAFFQQSSLSQIQQFQALFS